jgi:hypothetical protein
LTNGSRLFRCSVCAKKFESLHRTTELATGWEMTYPRTYERSNWHL